MKKSLVAIILCILCFVSVGLAKWYGYVLRDDTSVVRLTDLYIWIFFS
jgi:hypothetical protein